MSFRCFSGAWSRLERNGLACLCTLGVNWASIHFLLLLLCRFPYLPLLNPLRPHPVLAGLVGPMLGSVSQMLPWGKQQHLSPAQPWLSLSDKSLGGSCQRCPACHLSPLPPTQYPQPSPYTHIYTHTHFTLFTLIRLHPDSVTEAGGSLPFCPLAFYALVLGWHIYAGCEQGCRL